MPGIWAAGDIRGWPMFTHTSWDDHRILLSQLAGDGTRTTRRIVPYAVYTDPELGRVGATEEELRKAGRDIRVGRYEMRGNGKARERSEARGCIKVVVDAKTEKLLGASVLASDGSELVHVYVALMNADVSVKVLRDAIQIHPTLSEALQSAVGTLGMKAKKERAILSEADLDKLQRSAFDYFLHETHEASGLIRDSTHDGSPSSIAAIGLALTAYPVGVERGLMDRDEAAARTLTTLRFLMNARQSEEEDAAGHRGFFYHFLDMGSGRRAWDCELSTIDTAYVMAGALVAAAYFDGEEEGRARHPRDGRRAVPPL